MPKKSQKETMPEVFLAGMYPKNRIYYLRQQKAIRKIAPLLYTSNLEASIDDIVHRNLWQITGMLYPNAVISERTAVEMKAASDGSIFVISNKKRPTQIGSFVIRPKKGVAAQISDTPFMENLFLASPARIILENVSKTKSNSSKTSSRILNRVELEEYLENIIKQNGEYAINKLRSEMRNLAITLKCEKEFEIVNKIISALLRTHEMKLESKSGTARSKGIPFDDKAVEIFATLSAELERTAPIVRHCPKAEKNLYFFEAYFSNYIEGTKFEINDAHDIIYKNVKSQRPEDAHDIIGTYKIVSNSHEMKQTPQTFDNLVEILKYRHKILLAGRTDKKPGEFKLLQNQAGATVFVKPDLVIGTLKQGFEIYQKLTTPFARAVFVMFLTTQVHPFNDGNGRIGRIMMNAELTAANEQRIIIPTVYRNNYLSALRALSQNTTATALIKMLDFAQKWTAAVNWADFKTAQETLKITNAFTDSNEADDLGIRLTLPSRVI